MKPTRETASASRGAVRRSRSAVLAIVPVVLLVGALALAPASTAATIRKAGSGTGAANRYVAHQLLVRFDPEVDGATIARLNAGLGARTLKVFPFPTAAQVIETMTPSGVELKNRAACLTASPS